MGNGSAEKKILFIDKTVLTDRSVSIYLDIMMIAEPILEKAITPTVRRILDAAEAEFSASGYDGTGMKAISLRAGVAQSSLHYHFGNKELLYEAVIARRAASLSASREALLERVSLSAPDALEQIFEALYRPNFEEEGGGKAYAMIFNSRYVSDENAANLVNKYYDPTAEKFIDAILAASPGTSRDAAAWAYILAIGALFTALIRDGRQQRLAGRTSDVDATEVKIRALVLNAVGGFRRLAEEY